MIICQYSFLAKTSFYFKDLCAHCDIKPQNIMINFTHVECGSKVRVLCSDDERYFTFDGVVKEIRPNKTFIVQISQNRYVTVPRYLLRPIEDDQFTGVYLIDTGIARFGDMKWMNDSRNVELVTTWWRSPSLWVHQLDDKESQYEIPQDYTLMHGDMWSFGIVLLQIRYRTMNLYHISSVDNIKSYYNNVIRFAERLY